METLGGKPPKGVKVLIKDFDYQTKYMYALEAAMWVMPAVGIYSFRKVIERSVRY